MVDRMVQMALQVVFSSTSEWISRKQQSSSEKDDITVSIGRFACSDQKKKEDYPGANLPLIKTEAIIQNMTLQTMADLMMDSSKV